LGVRKSIQPVKIDFSHQRRFTFRGFDQRAVLVVDMVTAAAAVGVAVVSTQCSSKNYVINLKNLLK